MCTRVLALLALFVGLGHSFSWDVVVGRENQLEFYYNGTLTHAENIHAAHEITAVINDPVHCKVLFVNQHGENMSIYSFHISTREIKPLVTRKINYYVSSLAYDPVTQLLFWVEDYRSIYSLSLKPAPFKKSNDVNRLVALEDTCGDVAVDSCGGFIYWTTYKKIERAAFNGSKREVLIYDYVQFRQSLTIDQQTQKMYWVEETTDGQVSIKSADMNGKNRRTFYFIGTEFCATSLTVSNDFIYWMSYSQRAILQLPKSQQRGVGPTVYSNYNETHTAVCQLTAANYTIHEQTLGIKSCEALKILTLDVDERYGPICQNYCFEGNCSVSAEGHLKCRCNAGYSGERCEVNACYMYCLNNGVCSLNEQDEPVCQCTADYEGVRCEVPACRDSCVSAEGQCNCRYSANNSNERKVNAISIV